MFALGARRPGRRSRRRRGSVGAVNGEHYFSQRPASPAERRTIRVRLRGREHEVVTAGGVFSPERLDTGTRVLLELAPEPPETGAALDLGCGWGPIAMALAGCSPELDVWAVDVNERALELARDNAERAGLRRVRTAGPQEVPEGLRFRLVWSNPPIRIGKKALHGLLRQWLPRLEPGGEAYLVVAKQLGADSLQRWLAAELPSFEVSRHGTDRGFRVLRAARTAPEDA